MEHGRPREEAGRLRGEPRAWDAPDLRSAPGTALVGWESHPLLARAFGVADLVVGAGLLLDRRRSRWMFVRAFLDAAVAGVYALILAEGGARRTRSIGMTGLMSVLAVAVYRTARRLRSAESA